MSCVRVLSVTCKNNPGPALAPFEFEIQFECLQALKEDIEWKLTYVASAADATKDQVLDAIDLGPLTVGTLKFVLQTPPPDFSKMPARDVLGITAVLLSGSYKEHQFIRIGFYVHICYLDQELKESPPDVPILEKLHRTVMTDSPRVTRFNIEWDEPVASVCNKVEEQAEEPAGQENQLPPSPKDASAAAAAPTNSVEA
eukprot:GDKH01000234.1.p1 GENE.GDKH01000234.1~~GDKH01000234.1.p1  ORF type:complete len:199 (+),score=25.25 GDKH01000234.1:182-778(+)